MRHKIVIILTVFSLLLFPAFVGASSLQSQIDALNAEIAANQATLGNISHEAATLQAKVDAINAEVAQLQKQIDLANLQIEQTSAQISETVTKVEKQKQIMFENAKVLYKQGDPSTIEILASSDNFSEFVNKQEYLERVKESVNKAARELIALKTQLEDEQKQLTDYVTQQEAQRNIVQVKRDEQAQLLAQTRGEEAVYQGLVSSLKEKKAAAEAALAASLSSGSYKVAPVGQVNGGDVVGSMGSTGLSSGPHLHLEVRIGGSSTDPDPYIGVQPVQPTVVTQGYGNPDPIYSSGYHPGIDYGGNTGMAIKAINSGYLYRGCSDQLLGTRDNAYGYVAIIDHGSYISIYAHMSGGPAACDYNTYY